MPLTNVFYFSYLKKVIFLIHIYISERDLPRFETVV